MSDRAKRQDYLSLFDKRTNELKVRISDIKELIATMVEEEKGTRGETEMLVEMLKLLKTMKAFEIEAIVRLSAYNKLTRVFPPSD
jgi:regulator of replication initiation timing